MKSDSVSRCQVSQEVEFANTSNCLGPPSTQAVRTAEIDRLDRQITYEGGLLAPLTPSAQPLRGSHRTGKPFERRVDRHPSAWDLSAHGPDSMRRTSTVADPFQLQARLPRTRSPPTLAMLCSGPEPTSPRLGRSTLASFNPAPNASVWPVPLGPGAGRPEVRPMNTTLALGAWFHQQKCFQGWGAGTPS